MNNLRGNVFPKKQAVSARKAEANRKNAAKSTGPKTQRGKTNSRRNAFKHGLFTTYCFPDYLAKSEDSEEFRDLVRQLQRDHHVMGAAEALEVERIAVCWWRLRRATRYENAKLSIRSIGVASKAGDMVDAREYMPEQQRHLLRQLELAEKELEATGLLSQERKQEVFKAPWIEEWWLKIEESYIQEYEISGRELSYSPERRTEFARKAVLATVQRAMEIVEIANKERRDKFERVFSDGYAVHSLPDTDTMEMIFRYESAVQKELSRAYDRLERLQRRRIGEPLLPPVNLHLSR